jgi:triose/dihydroxyacetone kinase / FAD-AMP lyase (cyclizing)
MLYSLESALRRSDTIQDIKVVIDNTHKADEKVAIISGGGSGHEPAQAGFVGSGMLSGAVCGDVFASPTTEAVLAAIRALTRKGTGEEIKGCFLVWLNYTGDRINFGLAQEMARDEGYKVEILAVDDDIGVVSSGLAGSRGIAGQAFVLKVCSVHPAIHYSSAWLLGKYLKHNSPYKVCGKHVVNQTLLKLGCLRF